MPWRRIAVWVVAVWVVAFWVVAVIFAASPLALPRAGAKAHPRAATDASSLPSMRDTRTSPSDLEIGGELAGLPPGTTRYLTREELAKLSPVTYDVTDDANFVGPTRIGGVPLQQLTRALAADPASAMVVAICSDQYRANYPQAYIAEHRPLLVLTVNGQPPPGWPRDPENHREEMGPYLISHPRFTPAFKILSHVDEPQVPWGVVRLEFRNQAAVFGAIAPRGPQAGDELAQAGYRIAQQNCFRCHNRGAEGGRKSGHPWLVLSAWAATSPEYFSAYVRNPRSKNANSQMAGSPNYDDATLAALLAYFRTFSPPQPAEKP
jgi:mono/diheme cytochrome c family protein